MAFRLINNRFQDMGAKGFAATLALSVVLHFTQVLSMSITLPFVMPWIVLWLIGYSMINKREGEDK
jgi:hypothetical protein